MCLCILATESQTVSQDVVYGQSYDILLFRTLLSVTADCFIYSNVKRKDEVVPIYEYNNNIFRFIR